MRLYNILNEALIAWDSDLKDIDNTDIISGKNIKKRLDSVHYFYGWVDKYVGENGDYNLAYNRRILKEEYKKMIDDDTYIPETDILNVILLFKIFELEYPEENGTQQMLDLLGKMSTFVIYWLYCLNYKGRMNDLSICYNLSASINFIIFYIIYGKVPPSFNEYDSPFLHGAIKEFLANNATSKELNFFNDISRIFNTFRNAWTGKYDRLKVEDGMPSLYQLFCWKPNYPVPSSSISYNHKVWLGWKITFTKLSCP